MEDPKHVLFIKYEEMKVEPRDQIKRLAHFLGCPFTKEEEYSRLVDVVFDLCSQRNMSGLEVRQVTTFSRITSVKGKLVTGRIILLMEWRTR